MSTNSTSAPPQSGPEGDPGRETDKTVKVEEAPEEAPRLGAKKEIWNDYELALRNVRELKTPAQDHTGQSPSVAKGEASAKPEIPQG